jgi:hypothetical protein
LLDAEPGWLGRWSLSPATLDAFNP